MFDDVLKSISGPAIVTDMTGNIVQSNDAAQNLFGYSKRALLSLHIDDLIAEHQGMQLAIQRELLAAMPSRNKGRVGPPQELTALTRDSREIPAEVQMTLANRGRKNCVVTAFRDCTRERELAKKLTDTEQQLRALALMSSDWYWRQDAELRFTYMSARGKNTRVFDAQKVLGKKRSELPYVYESDARRIEHDQLLARRKSFQNLLVHNPENGRYARISGEPIHDDHGVFFGYHGVGTDVTEEMQSEHALRKSETRSRAITVLSSDWYWELDTDLKFTSMSGYHDDVQRDNWFDSIIGKTRFELPYVWESPAARAEHERLLADHQPFCDLLLHQPEKDYFALVTGEPVFDQHGTFCGYHGVSRDVSAEKHAEHTLRKSEARARALTALSSDWYWEQDADLRFTSMFGDNDETQLNTLENVVGKTRFELSYIWESPELRAEHERILAEHKPFRDLLLHNPENNRFALTTGEPIFDDHGKFCGYQGVSRDVTTEKRAEKALRESEERFRKLTDLSSDGYWEQDENLRYTYISRSRNAEASMSAEDFIGHTRLELGLVWESEAIKQQHLKTLEARLPFRDLLLHKPESNRFVLTAGEPIFDEQGKFQGYQGVTNDVTARKLAEAEALRLATHDALTGLPNRALLVDRVERAIALASRSKQYFAVLFIDMDRFKTLNDTFGHGIGDQFLRTASDRLGQVLRRTDTLARFGGDEFVVVLESLHGSADADTIARKMLALLSEPVDLDGTPFQTSASIGISMYPDNGTDTDTLMRHADLAMYDAKAAGRGCVRFYLDEMNNRVAERATLDRELRDAIDNGEFELYFHPQHDILTDRIDGAEVLLRWNHPEHGIIAPGEFIPAAEENGLILPIGQFVLERTFATIADWLSRGIVPPRLAVNISSRQLQDGYSLLNQARSLLNTSSVPRDLVEFEITESLLLDRDDDLSMKVLQALGKLGIRLSIDDFGTGYSSLSYLKRLPVNAIKIDRAFVTDIATNEESASIVRAVVGLAHNIKLEVVCEGVETEEQLTMLREMGCDTFQGFLREKPMSKKAFEQHYLNLSNTGNAQTPLSENIATH